MTSVCFSVTKVDKWLFTFCPMSVLLSTVLFGKWTDHVKSWRNSGLGDRIMFTTYEEMIEVKINKNSNLKSRVSD